MTFNPLNKRLNIAVQAICVKLFPTGYDVADKAPDTLEKLTRHINETGRMLVWSGASDETIFDDKEINWGFRAWHDFHHWQNQHAFTAQGEHAVFMLQCQDLFTLYGENDSTRFMSRILDAEINGQLRYQEKFGEFPENQIDFVKCYITSPKHALAGKW